MGENGTIMDENGQKWVKIRENTTKIWENGSKWIKNG
jgi:hypothetical protein